ncbi:MAG TPA: aminotransferase class I/II-fold pyridoxal phosphate-dependent enzyme [Gaiellaceae bacterium]|nr:aminotransferase class I/II-fold pyridoxal phosphate-dependent enzyme [Gaiellaceae bacterium]
MSALATSGRIEGLPRSGIRGIMELALELPDAIRLEIGDPDFPTPPHIVEAAAEAARAGFTHYAPGIGLSSLRELIAEKVVARNGFACTPDRVVVTTGACGALHASFLVLLDPGDEVLVPDPGWTTMTPMALAAGVTPVPYALDRRRAFALDPAAVEARIGPRTRALVVNSPGNPTGAVASREALEQVLDLADRHGLWLISDECYEELVFEGEHLSPASLGDPDRVLSVFSFSKTYAMTGWRIGYAVGPPAVVRQLAKAQEAVVSSSSTVSQKAAEAALLGSQEAVAGMRDAYRRRRDAAFQRLDADGIAYARPSGAFYLMVDVSTTPETSEDFALRLLRDQHVAVVPGSAFGAGGEGYVRVSLAAAADAIEAGLARLALALRPPPGS